MKNASPEQRSRRASQLCLRTTKVDFLAKYAALFSDDNIATDSAFKNEGYVVVDFMPDFVSALRKMSEPDYADVCDYIEARVWEEDLYQLCAVNCPITPDLDLSRFVIPDLSDYFYKVAKKEIAIRNINFVAIINPDVLTVNAAADATDL